MNSGNAVLRLLGMVIAPIMIFGALLVCGTLFQVLVLQIV